MEGDSVYAVTSVLDCHAFKVLTFMVDLSPYPPLFLFSSLSLLSAISLSLLLRLLRVLYYNTLVLILCVLNEISSLLLLTQGLFMHVFISPPTPLTQTHFLYLSFLSLPFSAGGDLDEGTSTARSYPVHRHPHKSMHIFM